MRAVAVLAVLPEYRANFVAELQEKFAAGPDQLVIVAGDAHLDETVRSSEFHGVIRVRNRGLLGRRLLWQSKALSHTYRADVVVIDLNPRSLTSWFVLIGRKLSRGRTLAWGHILPRRGADSITAPLRRGMRRMADGVISYTWSDAQRVRDEDGSASVWVAANGLYPASTLGFNEQSERNRLLYVGRIEPAKKPLLALDAFVLAIREGSLPDNARLTFVGSGSQLPVLRERVAAEGIADRVDVLGHISELETLRGLYGETAASLSPGYVGLSLTQSLGFGVPMLIADDEPHAPEFELATPVSSRMFRADDARALADEMVRTMNGVDAWDRAAIVQSVSETYSSTAMADGFVLALRGEQQGDRHGE